MTLLSKYANLQKAFELLASDNGLTMQLDVQVPRIWVVQFEVANNQAGYLDGKPLETFVDCSKYDSADADESEDSLDYIVNGEHSIVEVLVKEARVQTLHEVLNAAFDGELHNTIFITGRMRHARR